MARAAPGGWPATTIPSGARLAYPPGWRAVHGDRGTASVALLGAGGRYLAYLNATPRQGPETLGGWTTFRLKHNAEEGDRHITRLAAQTQLRFLNGSGSCVKDSYATVIGAHYIEIACIVSTGSRSTVVVAAAPPTSWPRVSPLLERAISAFKA